MTDFDLSKYEDVRTHAGDTYARLADGWRPCIEAYSDELSPG
jgi:hypothetical protein